jgi:hypothetical protein
MHERGHSCRGRRGSSYRYIKALQDEGESLVNLRFWFAQKITHPMADFQL